MRAALFGFFAVISLSLPTKAGITRSATCLTILEILRHETPTQSSAEKIYTLNSFKSFGEFLYRGSVEDVTPAVPEGFVSDNAISGDLNFVQVAGRIKGIEEFSKQDGDDPSSRRFSISATVYGQSSIVDFIKAISRKSLSSELYSLVNVGTYLFLATVSSGAVYWSNDLPTAHWLLGLLTVATLEPTMTYLHQKQNNLSKNLKQLSELTENYKQGSWVFYAQNFEITKKFVDSIMSKPDLDGYQKGGELSYKTAHPFLISSTLERSPLDRFIDKESYEENVREYEAIKDKYWVGLDMLLLAGPDGEPELHIIMRGSHKAPPFPRTSKEKKQDRRTSGLPQTQTEAGLVPIRIPTK